MTIGTLALSHPLYISEVKTDDLPEFQRSKVAENVSFGNPQDADVLVDDLRLRAADCRRLRTQGTPCGTGPDATPTMTPSRTPAPRPTTAPASTPTSTEATSR
jgi:PPM family protein phosphatase